MRTGRIESVWLERRGSQLVADAPEGTQVLSIAFSGDFDEDGGQLYHVPSDTVYDYSAFDADAETITLSAPLPTGVSFEYGDAIRVYPLADDAYALVRLEDVESDEPITARLSQGVRPVLPEGLRESGLGETVVVESFGAMWIVTDVSGNNQKIDGTEFHLEGPGGSYFDFSFQNVRESDNAVMVIKGESAYIGWHDGDDNLRAWNELKKSVAGEPYLWEYIDGANIHRMHAQNNWYLVSDVGENGGVVFDTSGTLRKFRWGGSYDYIDDFVTEDWNDLTLVNGWTARAGFYTPGIRLNALGHVELRGGMWNGVADNGTAIANIPANYRPPAEVGVPVMTNNGYTYRAVIKSDGTVALSHPQGIEPTFSTVILTGSYPLS